MLLRREERRRLRLSQSVDWNFPRCRVNPKKEESLRVFEEEREVVTEGYKECIVPFSCGQRAIQDGPTHGRCCLELGKSPFVS